MTPRASPSERARHSLTDEAVPTSAHTFDHFADLQTAPPNVGAVVLEEFVMVIADDWGPPTRSPVLLDEADAGDEVAWQIVSEGGTHVGGQGRISAERIDLEVAGSLVVMSGGLFRHPSTVPERAIMNELPGAVSARTTRPRVVGALLAAMDMVGEDWDADELHRSLQTFEAAHFGSR